MSSIFYRGQFDGYKVSDLTPALESVVEAYSRDSAWEKRKTTVFLSHKHDDLDDLKGVIGWLEEEFNVEVYIDSMDKSMPQNTSGITATRIKKKIRDCDKFILLATDKAVESKWCNWELGYGDAKKSAFNNLALFPMKESSSSSFYKGNEYLEIYPYIVSQSEYVSSRYIQKVTRYYVKYQGKLTPLKEWFTK